MTVKEIIEVYLKDNGFDGLFCDCYDCACDINDLCPCEEYFGSCEPGYKTPCDCEEGHNYHIDHKKVETPKGELADNILDFPQDNQTDDFIIVEEG